MEVFFNELSCQPLATNRYTANSKIITMLQTMKLLRNDDFNVMRTPENFYLLEIAPGYSFSQFLNDPNESRVLKSLLQGIARTPYIEDDNSSEAGMFLLTDFKTKNHLNVDVSPEGLATAYIFNSPSISLSGHAHWQRDLIPVSITDQNDSQNSFIENIPNVYSEISITSQPFRNWILSLNDTIPLNCEENITTVFSQPLYEFDARAIREIISWYYDDIRFLIRIKELIFDIVNHPFVGGKGSTEALGGTGGRASKRIIKKDRIVYTYTKEKITIHQCRGHYDDN